MIRQLFEERLAHYNPAGALEQEHVLVELVQQYILAGLARSGLFRGALFHGGTCLRIVHGTSRFSEDLDFMTKAPEPAFRWHHHLDQIRATAAREGLELEILDRSRLAGAVKKGFVKTAALGTIVQLTLPFARDLRKKIRIKLEMDTEPPQGSRFETAYLSFPFLAAITTQSLESSFATKSHALLCRPYVKGRDWYDFLWYVDRSVVPDLELLHNALDQQGPWAGQGLPVTAAWYLEALEQKIGEVDWAMAREDVRRFIPASGQPDIDLWSRDLFLFNLRRLAPAVQAAEHQRRES